MKYILIGSDGFVGQNLVERNQNSYYCFDNGFLQKSLLKKTTYLDISKSLSSLESLLKEINGSFTIINLAAIHHIPYCNEHPEEAMLVNVYGNMRLFELAAEYKCSNFIFASSGAVYFPKKGGHLESDIRKGTDVYSATKILAENYLENACYALGVPTCVLRFFNIAGQYDLTPHLIPDIVDQIIDDDKNEISLGNLTTVRDYICVDDICSILEYFLNNRSKNIYEVHNVGTGLGLSGKDLFELVVSLSGTKKPKFIDQSRFRESDRPSQIADTTNLVEVMGGFEFTPIRKSLENYLAWRGLTVVWND